MESPNWHFSIKYKNALWGSLDINSQQCLGQGAAKTTHSAILSVSNAPSTSSSSACLGHKPNELVVVKRFYIAKSLFSYENWSHQVEKFWVWKQQVCRSLNWTQTQMSQANDNNQIHHLHHSAFIHICIVYFFNWVCHQSLRNLSLHWKNWMQNGTPGRLRHSFPFFAARQIIWEALVSKRHLLLWLLIVTTYDQ